MAEDTAILPGHLEDTVRSIPQMRNRVDEETAAMAQPADPQAMFEAIQETHSELIAQDGIVTY